jgi:hypothetical protein
MTTECIEVRGGSTTKVGYALRIPACYPTSSVRWTKSSLVLAVPGSVPVSSATGHEIWADYDNGIDSYFDTA